ncbi:MAG: TraB/GumN family protein [Chitinophagales bacterium]|nr:TraB/GumN family protein [Chitinophagales bacterium]
MRVLAFAIYIFVYCSAGAQNRSLLYMVTGNNLPDTSYIFGTMHTGDVRVIQKALRVLPYLSRCNMFAPEIDIHDKLDMNVILRLMMGKGYSIKSMLPEREYRFLDSLIYQQVGMPAAVFDNVAPVVLLSIVEAAVLVFGDSADLHEPLDLYLTNIARRENKKVIGLETIEEQLLVLNTLTYQEQADLLIREIAAIQQNNFRTHDLLQHYLNENLDEINRLENSDSLPEKFYDALVTQRNKRMTGKIISLIKKGSVFVAVGALHLPGKEGVLTMLEERGFNVQAIPPPE